MENNKRNSNFKLALRDSLVAELGNPKGRVAYSQLLMAYELGAYCETSGDCVPVSFKTLCFLGERCLLDALSSLFKNPQNCQRVFRGFINAKEKHIKSGGKQCAIFDCRTSCYNEDVKTCTALRLMANAGKPKKPGNTAAPPLLVAGAKK